MWKSRLRLIWYAMLDRPIVNKMEIYSVGYENPVIKQKGIGGEKTLIKDVDIWFVPESDDPGHDGTQAHGGIDDYDGYEFNGKGESHVFGHEKESE